MNGGRQSVEKSYRRRFYVTVNDKCYRITSQKSEDVLALQYQQEEADRYLLLHAATEGYHAIVICSEDMNIFIMCIVFHDKIELPLFQKCSTTFRTIAATVGVDAYRVLIGLHAYTKCDTVIAFARK